jgi:hypothetical protein
LIVINNFEAGNVNDTEESISGILKSFKYNTEG